MRKDLTVLFCVFLCVFSLHGFHVNAKSNQLSARERLSLARSFVSKLKPRLEPVESISGVHNQARTVNILPDGERLLLQPVIEKSFRPDAVITARIENQQALISLRDFSDALQMAITFSEDGKRAQGWYVREDRVFSLDAESRVVKTNQGEFSFSEQVLLEGDDIWVPAEEVGRWLNFDFALHVDLQEVDVSTDVNLPIYAQFLRRNNEILTTRRNPVPSLPLGGDESQLAGVPVLDVNTATSYRRNSGGDGLVDQVVNLRAVGDLAHGTLDTQVRLDNRDGLALVRTRYSQDSLEGDLLGPLKATRLELGDVTTPQVPFGGNIEQELGVRITNADPVRGFARTTTAISGQSIPGWDVELYRGTRLLAFQTIGDDGFYQFSNIDLFQSDNRFRLVFYGLQGEVREEEVFIPFDRRLFAQGKGVYDVSLTLDEENTFTAQRFENGEFENEGSLSLSAVYEQPIVGGVTAVAGLQSSENVFGERNTIGSLGVSATVNETLLNASAALDDDGDAIAVVGARRSFGKHEVATSVGWNNSGLLAQTASGLGSGFSTVANSSVGFDNNGSDAFNTSLRVNGPLLKRPNFNLRYSGDVQYDFNTDDDERLALSAGLNGNVGRTNVSTNLRHETNVTFEEGDRTDLFATVSRAQGKNRYRLNANYEIQPEPDLQSVIASYNRRFNRDLNGGLDITRLQETSVTEFQARLDWQGKFIRISPSVRYDTDNDFFAGLNTRFGLVRDPTTKEFEFQGQNIGTSGLVSAFVFLDKDGNGVYDGDDEPLEGVDVLAPQNGRQETTNADGVALFTRMTRLRLTDVFVDSQSLQDPSWIPGFDGVSILPRQGYVAQIDFPVHSAGEVDGTIYAQAAAGSDARALQGVKVALYNDRGGIEQSVSTDSGGFYYFSSVPPGRYLLILDEDSAKRKKVVRPLPQPIEIGYDGTVLFGNDIYVETGAGDVSTAVLTDLQAYQAQHPHVDFDPDLHDVVLNLGEYNSRLLMSVVWYKIRSRFQSVLAGAELFVSPAESYADTRTGKHALRVGLGQASIENAYERCRVLSAQEQFCKVEILPASLKKANLVD